MKIKFLQDVEYSGGGIPSDAVKFSANQVVNLAEASARHWIHRRLAEAVGDSTAPSPVKTEEPSDDRAVPANTGFEKRRNKLVDPDGVDKK